MRKISALKNSTDQQPRQYPAKGNYGKGVKGKGKSRNKGKANDQNKRHKKGKGHWTKNW